MGMTNKEAKEVLAFYRFNLIQSTSNQLSGDIEAFDMAIKALEQTKWIPVSERLPELPENRWNNFLVTEKVHTLKGDVIEVDTESFFNGKFQSNTEVIAWMPLPKAYEEVE